MTHTRLQPRTASRGLQNLSFPLPTKASQRNGTISAEEIRGSKKVLFGVLKYFIFKLRLVILFYYEFITES